MTEAAVPPPDHAPTLGQLIAEHRARKHWGRPQLALLVGASLSSIKNWEADRVCPSPTHLAALEEALGVRFINDSAGALQAVDPAPEAAPAPRVVVIVAATAEAAEAAVREAMRGVRGD